MDKLEAMILHLATACLGHRGFSPVTLCRLCYFGDFGHDSMYGTPISGTRYIMRGGGPEPVGMEAVLTSMSRRRLLRIVRRNGEERVIPLSSSGDILADDEIRSLDEAVETYGGMNDRMLSWVSRTDSPCRGIPQMGTVEYPSHADGLAQAEA